MSIFKPGDLVRVISETFEPDVITRQQALNIIMAQESWTNMTGKTDYSAFPPPFQTASSHYWWLLAGSDGSPASGPSFEPGVGSVGMVVFAYDDIDAETDEPVWYTAGVSFLHSRNGHTCYHPGSCHDSNPDNVHNANGNLVPKSEYGFEHGAIYSFNDRDLILLTPADAGTEKQAATHPAMHTTESDAEYHEAMAELFPGYHPPAEVQTREVQTMDVGVCDTCGYVRTSYAHYTQCQMPAIQAEAVAKYCPPSNTEV